MAENEKSSSHDLALLKALDVAIEKGPWDISPFFQTMRDRLIGIRDRFKKEAHLEEKAPERVLMPATLFGRIAKRSGLVEVYIVLYNSDGMNLQKWESILRSVEQHIISRPIYRYEKNARAALHAAVNKPNEAYIAVFIHEEDILAIAPERIPKDRHGIELLTLKDNVVKHQNIFRFVHVSGIYEFKGDKLTWQSAAEL
jgi:intracellular multiplication protein IcmQ